MNDAFFLALLAVIQRLLVFLARISTKFVFVPTINK